MTKAGKITAAVSGTLLLLIVVLIVLIATFDWNRLKPTINQKVSTELNRPFAIRGDLGVVWERQKQETGWRSWVPWPHVHAEDIILGNPPDIPEVTMVHLPRVEATLAPLALLTKTVWLPWIKLVKPDARLIRLSEKNNNWTFTLAADEKNDPNAQPSAWSFRLDTILFDQGRIALTIRSAKPISRSWLIRWVNHCLLAKSREPKATTTTTWGIMFSALRRRGVITGNR